MALVAVSAVQVATTCPLHARVRPAFDRIHHRRDRAQYLVPVHAADVAGYSVPDDVVRQVEVARQVLAHRRDRLPVGLTCTLIAGICEALTVSA